MYYQTNSKTMYNDDMLLTPLEDLKQEDSNIAPSELFISFLNRLEGWKTKCKNLHWAAPIKIAWLRGIWES